MDGLPISRPSSAVEVNGIEMTSAHCSMTRIAEISGSTATNAGDLRAPAASPHSAGAASAELALALEHHRAAVSADLPVDIRQKAPRGLRDVVLRPPGPGRSIPMRATAARRKPPPRAAEARAAPGTGPNQIGPTSRTFASSPTARCTNAPGARPTRDTAASSSPASCWPARDSRRLLKLSQLVE